MTNAGINWTRAAVVSALSITPTLVAQTPGTIGPPIIIGGGTSVGGSSFVEAWVDADLGVSSPMIGDPTRPYGDIQGAINAVRAMVSFNEQNGTGPTEGLVHINPAIYEIDSTIVLQPDVHLQGKDAGACIIRPSAWMDTYPVFLPEGGACGAVSDQVVLMDVHLTQDGPQDDVVEIVEGLQFQGGDVQLYMQKEGPGAITIANCIFDMLPERIDDEYGDPSTAPLFGILMVETWDLAIGGYHQFDANILNNTFIQGHRTQFGEQVVVGNADGVAIATVNEPLCDLGPDGDPDPTLRQVIDLNVQNNLIRSFSDEPRNSMLGVSGEDTRAAVGTRHGATNAFIRGTAGSNGFSGRFSSQVKSSNPYPVVNIQSIDPGFVGEMAQMLLLYYTPDAARRDWRLLPGSPLEDMGSSPSQGGRLQSESGVAYLHGTNAPMPRSAFDWDGEHYGNRRIEGAGVDIGADEVGEFILIARVNDTLSPIAMPSEAGIFRSTSRVRLRQRVGVPMGAAWSSPPGSRVPPKTFFLSGGVLATNWLLAPVVNTGTTGTSRFTWINPTDGSQWNINHAGLPAYGGGFATTYSQAVIEPLGQAKFWSNTQYSE